MLFTALNSARFSAEKKFHAETQENSKLKILITVGEYFHCFKIIIQHGPAITHELLIANR